MSDAFEKCLITGGSGLVGRHLRAALESAGLRVFTSSRGPAKNTNSVQWNPENSTTSHIDTAPYQHILHLAGENISGGRWTKSFKNKLWNSRIESTRILVDQILRSKNRPLSFICASAIGFYGNRDEETCNEDSPKGDGFLADLCDAWEAQTKRLSNANVRVVNLRIGIVLSTEGGALAKMIPAFKWGLGGQLGSGNQWMSWIHIDDLIKLILFSLKNTGVSGPLNAVAPEPARNSDFTATLARLLHRPQGPRAPEWALKLALREMAQSLLLASIRVEPLRALNAGFQFEYSSLNSSLSKLLTKSC